MSPKYAIEAARLQNAQVYCIHAITTIPYGYSLPGSSVDQYFESAKDQAQSWFDKVIDIAKKTGKDSSVVDIMTDIFADVTSVTDAIVNYASKKNIDLIVIGTKGRTGLKRFLLGSVPRSPTACSLSSPACQIRDFRTCLLRHFTLDK